MSAGPRQLVVMRHAKAAQLPGSPDFERPLTARGHRDAAAAGRWLAGRGLEPEAVLCSPARRTRQTWQAAAAELGPDVTVPSLDDILYTADAAAIREIIAATAPEVTTLLCVGHNPAMADLAQDATGQPLEFPTAAIAVAVLPGPWASVADGPGDLAAYWTPKLAAG